MQPTSRFETPLSNRRAITKLLALIADLHRQVQLLDLDIREEEQRTRILDITDIAYPILAQNLRARRDNLMATITVLESQLAQTGLAA